MDAVVQEQVEELDALVHLPAHASNRSRFRRPVVEAVAERIRAEHLTHNDITWVDQLAQLKQHTFAVTSYPITSLPPALPVHHPEVDDIPYQSVFEATMDGLVSGRAAPYLSSFWEVPPQTVWEATGLSTWEKSTFFLTHPDTSSELLAEAHAELTLESPQYLLTQHPNFPVDQLNDRPFHLQQAAIRTDKRSFMEVFRQEQMQFKDLSRWMERSQKGAWEAFGQQGDGDWLHQAREACPRGEMKLAFFAGVLQRPEPLEDHALFLRVFSEAVGALQFQPAVKRGWWRQMMHHRTRLSLRETLLLHRVAGDALKVEDERLLANWLQEDGELNLGSQVDDLPPEMKFRVVLKTRS